MSHIRQTIQNMLHVLEANNKTQADVYTCAFLEGKSVSETCIELHIAGGY